MELLRRSLLTAALATTLPLAVTEAYARVPQLSTRAPPPSLPTPPSSTTFDTLVLVLHGAGGPDANTRRIAEALEAPSTLVVEYDYAACIGDQLRAPYDAMRVGEHLANEVVRLAPRRLVHVIGVSVGAFAADRLARRLAAQSAIRQRVTFLDPFTARGVLGLLRPETAYGVREFGASVGEGGVVVSVLNTDDPVPSTNLPLRHAVNYDITGSVAKRSFEPLAGDSSHSWPAAWFGSNARRLDGLLRSSSAPRSGSVTAIVD